MKKPEQIYFTATEPTRRTAFSRRKAQRLHEMPADLASALSESKTRVDLWESLTPIARNEFICWIEEAKQEKTRVKRIHRTVEELADGKRRPCCWPGCIHRTDK